MEKTTEERKFNTIDEQGYSMLLIVSVDDGSIEGWVYARNILE